jgi:structural maintenance of chromosome 4
MTENAEAMDQEDEEGYVREGGITIGDIYIPPAPRPACTFDANGPRLVITHIENENFKSYAGLQVIIMHSTGNGWLKTLTFHKGGS